MFQYFIICSKRILCCFSSYSCCCWCYKIIYA